MTIKEMLKIFREENIEIINLDNLRFEEKSDNGENYYYLENIEEQWKLYFYERGNTSIKNIFNNIEDALKYFCVFELKQKINREYVIPAIRESDILYSETLELKNVFSLFHKYNIKKDHLEGYVVDLIKTSDEHYNVIVLNNEKNTIYSTEKIDCLSALFVYFKWSYAISLIELFQRRLYEKGILSDHISDSDIIILLLSN